jgi:DNA-binding protein Fis
MTIMQFPNSGQDFFANFRSSVCRLVHMKPVCFDEDGPDAKRRRPTQVLVSEVMQTRGASNAVRETIKASLSEFLTNLAIACTSVPGEEDSIDSETDERMYVAREHIADEMATMIVSGRKSDSSFQKLCVYMYQQHALKAIKRYKAHVSACVDGIDMLAIVAASSNRVDDVTKLLTRYYATIKKVCADPPRVLLESMALHGIASTVLTVLFNHCGPSVAKAARILCQYLSTIAHRLHNACMDAVKLLRAQLELPSDSYAWSQIVLVCPDTDRVDLVEACRVPPPPHLSCGSVATIARPTGASGALRIPRFVRALQLCVTQIGSAELWQHMDTDYACNTSNSHKGEWVVPSKESVPEELKRDFNILVAIERQLPMGAGVLDASDVTKLLMMPGAFFSDGSTQRSVEQAVHHVMRKSAYQVYKQNKDGCGIEYIKGEGLRCSIGHLRLDAAGSAMLRIRVREIVTCMGSHNRKMHPQPQNAHRPWRASRSSRSMAAAARRAK